MEASVDKYSKFLVSKANQLRGDIRKWETSAIIFSFQTFLYYFIHFIYLLVYFFIVLEKVDKNIVEIGEVITLDVGGTKFLTSKKNLLKFPNTYFTGTKLITK